MKKLLSDAGRFGQCYLAEDALNPSRQFAVKVLSISSENRAAIEREAKVMVCSYLPFSLVGLEHHAFSLRLAIAFWTS